MVTEEKCNGNGSISDDSKRVNGFLHGCSSGSGDGSSLRTYKRRKCGKSNSKSYGKFVDLENMPCTISSAQLDDKMEKESVDIELQKNSCVQVCNPKINCHSHGSDVCSYQHWKNALENICQSLCPTEGGGCGIPDCIRAALHSNPGSSLANMAQKTVDYHESDIHLQRTILINGSSTEAKGFSTVNSNVAPSDSGHFNLSRQSERAFFRLMMSGNFSSLCKMLSENLHGLKIENFLDFSTIDSRMKEGAYESLPMLFLSDIQQVWKKLRIIGNEMVSFSNNMIELSRAVCHDLGGGAVLDTSGDKRHELNSQDLDVRIKQEELDTSLFCTCRQCGERSDGKDCLVCDSCEGMFHVSCIQPAVKEIPHKSWYCANCTASGIASPHEDCAVCVRLMAQSGINGVNAVPLSEETLDDKEETSYGIIVTGPQVFRGSKRLPCKLCGSILSNGEEFLLCEHSGCTYKYYHTRCLTNKELNSYGPRWYCPSCLCRVCLTDKDDADIMMCDGCDHGYHTYCLNPPRSSIPKGKWYCPKCDVGIKAIRRIKKFYEDIERKQMKYEEKRGTGNSSKKSKLDFENAAGGSGGMDMLLSAARTLNDEELTVQEGLC